MLSLAWKEIPIRPLSLRERPPSYQCKFGFELVDPKGKKQIYALFNDE